MREERWSGLLRLWEILTTLGKESVHPYCKCEKLTHRGQVLAENNKPIFPFHRRHCVAVIHTLRDENTGLFLAVPQLHAESGKGTSCCS